MNGLISWRVAFQKLYRRHASIAAARSSISLCLGETSSFSFSDGIVSWISPENQLQKLDTHKKSGLRQYFDIETALDQLAINWRNNIKLLSSFQDIAVFVVKTAQRGVTLLGLHCVEGSRACILIFDRTVRSDNELFVRQNTACIVIGYYCTPSNNYDARARWTIEVMRKSSSPVSTDHNWSTHHLRRGFGETHGKDVAFALYDGCFYAVSTPKASRLIDAELTFFYDCHWIAIDNVEELQFDRIYRRKSNEGPINDTWTSLQLLPSSKTGELMILETRREWIDGAGQDVRSCYIRSLNGFLEPDSHQSFKAAHLVWVHHDCDSQMLKGTSLLYKAYNLAASSFIDIGMTSDQLCFRTSCSSNRALSFEESLKAGYISKYRNEEDLFLSRAPHVFKLQATQHDSDGHSYGQNHLDGFSAATDDRVVVFLIGYRDKKVKHLVLIDFDPEPWSNVS